MFRNLFTPEEVSVMILRGDQLLLSGDIEILSQLPKGNWIGGTTPFFVLYPEQMITSHDKIFVCQLPEYGKTTTIRKYDVANLHNIYNDAPDNGFTVLIVPFKSEIATEFALNSTNYENFATRPLCGWQSGRSLETLLTKPSHVVLGIDGQIYTDKAIAMHVELPETKYAELHIFNPYKQGKGDDIRFDYSGMVLKDAYINDEKRNLAAYLKGLNYSKRLPFVANYSGAMINVTCVDIGEDEVYMYAPVFKSINYRIAELDSSLSEPTFANEQIVFSVTCIINFLQPEICAKYLKEMNGPVGYGEVAYQLLNQTTVYVTVGDVHPES